MLKVTLKLNTNESIHTSTSEQSCTLSTEEISIAYIVSPCNPLLKLLEHMPGCLYLLATDLDYTRFLIGPGFSIFVIEVMINYRRFPAHIPGAVSESTLSATILVSLS